MKRWVMDKRVLNAAVAVLIGALLSACASPVTGPNGSIGAQGLGSRPSACRTAERIVASEAECLQDDASCYILADGNWCTGPRAARCPAGSSPLPSGVACPSGERCIRISESLECRIAF